MNKLLKAEKKIRKKESQQSLPPHSEKTYEKALLCSPNSSFLWVKYASFMLDRFGLEKSREVFETAAKQISQVEEREKLNIYLAWMNLENSFGDPKSFEKITERALLVNDHQKILAHKALKFLQNQNLESCEEALKYLCKKYSKDLSNWENLLRFYLKTLKNEMMFDETIRKGVQSTRNAFEIKKIVATLFYENNEPEKAKTLLESLISEKPKRSDIWFVYLQFEDRLGHIDAVQELYERVLYTKISPKLFKTFSKSYHSFLLRHDLHEKALEIAGRFNITLDDSTYLTYRR